VIKNVVACLQARYQKGIVDVDPAVRRNIGLLKESAISIDIGSFFLSPELKTHHELVKDTRRLRKWLLKRSPELAAYLDDLVNEPQDTREMGKGQ
jgi:hypothetical protein